MSNEQLNVVAVCARGNCAVDSVAGSGKTTTCLLLADTYPNDRNLLLTYNAKLKLETRFRVDTKGLSNLEVHSYHSFCVKFYHPKAYDDSILRQIVDKNMCPVKPFRFDRIILDEAQDMTPMLYGVFRKLFNDNGDARLCVMGDQKQSIYEFRKADARFLTLASHIFSGSWTSLKLSTTYRLTIPMADFVNSCMLKESRLHAVKPSDIKPEYIICDTFTDTIYNKVTCLLKEYAPEDFFLVAPSIRSPSSPLIKLENRLVKNNVPCFVPIHDDEIVDDSVLTGKIALSTIHQTKGMERKVVIIFGFDNSYFKYYKKDADPQTCPNELYVAATRATDRLIFVHHESNDYLPFLCRHALKSYEEGRCLVADDKPFTKFPVISVTNLLRHLDNTAMEHAYSKLRRIPVTVAGPVSVIADKICGDTIESVSHITGTAIPTFYEYLKKGKMTILEALQGRDSDFHDVHQHMSFLKKTRCPPICGLNQIQYPPSVQELLFTVNCWNAATTGYICQVQQIHAYDWLSTDMLQACTSRLDACLQKVAINAVQFEKECMKPEYARMIGPSLAEVDACYSAQYPELKGRVLVGRADLIGSDKLIEIKCTNSLTVPHYLQLALYSYLHKASAYYMFNVLTDELVEVQCDDLPGMVEILFNAKYATRITMSDEEFIHSCVTLPLNPRMMPFLLIPPCMPKPKCSVCRKSGHNKSRCPDKAFEKPVTPNASVAVIGIIGVFDIESSGSNVVNELGMVLVDINGTHLPQEFHCVTRDEVTGWAASGCPGLKCDAAKSAMTFIDLFNSLLTFICDNDVKVLMAHSGVSTDFPTLIRAAIISGIDDPVGQLERAGIAGLADPARFIPQFNIRELQHDGKWYKSNEDLFHMAMGGPMEDFDLQPHRALDDAKAERAWLPLILSTLQSLPCATSLKDLRDYIQQYDRHKQFTNKLNRIYA